MKLVLAAALAVFALNSFAEESLKEMKAKANDHITSKISSLESAKGCVNGATTKEAFKACKYDLHESMKMQKEEAMEDKIDDSKEEE